MANDIFNSKYTILDGAMGTMLQRKGMKPGTIPETLNITKPEWISDIHAQYIEAGADIVYANTFGANRLKMEGSGFELRDIISAAITNAKKPAQEKGAKVALDIGPIGALLEPTGTMSFEEAYDIFKEIVLCAGGADLAVVETMTDLLETKAAVLAIKENSNLPVICTMTFEKNMRTFTGCSIASMCLTLQGLGVDAIGVNCSLGPKDLVPIVEEIRKWTDIPIVVKANAGLPDPKTNEYNVLPLEFATIYKQMIRLGASVLGGCCGTTPEYIKEIKKMLEDDSEFAREPYERDKTLSLCSPLKVVKVSEPRIIGERINPTGKARFKQALRENDMNYILSQAIEQIEAGADILDVNVGSPDIDEKEMMVKTVKAIQSIADVPLQIDSTKPEVIEAALRVYNGKPIVNSVNGEEKSLSTILPMIAKYGAAVIGLTLDEDGIPKKAEDRLEIAKKIMNRALSLGIKKEDIIIDCLVMTVSAEQDAAKETLKAVNMVKSELGLKTVLGVSNISFGLPNRAVINRAFLTMALERGLDLPIMNPNMPPMMWAMKAFKVLHGFDTNSMDFIEYSNTNEPDVATPGKEITVKPAEGESGLSDEKGNLILKAMETGLKEDARVVTRELLESRDSMDIVNGILIPALDIVGDKFEKGKIFLPQLILAADVAKECFEEIKLKVANEGSSEASKGRIILATVKGDIHDIGKNIVKIILENYGYDVVDLGRDVDPMLIVNTAKEQNIKLVGLSALMTTTLGAMKETIDLLHENNVDCKIMVGGAVLTEDYAMQIKADYYAKDAKMSADIAKKVLAK